MASSSQYPDHLNPFGSDDDTEQNVTQDKQIRSHDDYPGYLSPFRDDANDDKDNVLQNIKVSVGDYDDSLNPFSLEDDCEAEHKSESGIHTAASPANEIVPSNPFDEDEISKDTTESSMAVEVTTIREDGSKTPELSNECNNSQPTSISIQQELLEPPKPLPRTKSLLKKEQAIRNQQSKQQLQTTKEAERNESQVLDSSLNMDVNNLSSTSTTSIQKKKRNAPPVPINFKRQVSGSLDAIEIELNEIGDKLAIIEKENVICQDSLKANYKVDEEQFSSSKAKLIELIKRKNSIVRRQRDLMYRKRELKLDQIHSDIEYELRMIGNKQLSHRTSSDESREKELLKKLVEIVEEKNDIVENLNKDTCRDGQDISEALKRLNIEDEPPGPGLPSVKVISKNDNIKNLSSVKTKNQSCDKDSPTMGRKLSKIATLLPKTATLKGTMKIKRKHLFRKSDSHQIDR